MIGIAASIAGVVTLLSILVAVYFFRQRRRYRRARKTAQQMGIEGGPGFTESGVTPPLDPQSAQLSGSLINKPTPYPMEKYTSALISPYFVQSVPNDHVLDRSQQMQTLDVATADLDRIAFTPTNGTKIWSPPMSPSSTSHSQDIQNSEPSIGTREQPKATVPISPLSSISNFGDSIIPASYVRVGITEAVFGTGGRGGCPAARRSSTTVNFPGQDMIDCEGRDGHGDPGL